MMSLPVFWHNQVDYWELGTKFRIDYGLKHIIIHSYVTTLDIKLDIYKALKQDVNLRDNSRYAYPIRTIGGDDTGGGQSAGDIYFLINGYRIVYDPTRVQVTGILYSDNFDTPWLYSEDTSRPVYPAVVSNLALSVKSTIEDLDVPTAAETAAEVRIELTPELALIDASISSRASQTSIDALPGNILEEPLSGHTTANTLGDWVNNKGLTVLKFVGTK